MNTSKILAELKNLLKPSEFSKEFLFIAKNQSILQLSEDRNVRLSFVERGHSQHYVSVLVKIVDKDEGEIDKCYFNLSDYSLNQKNITYISYLDGYKNNSQLSDKELKALCNEIDTFIKSYQ
tara:strand:- start:1346 stop:1711 length:366 start_codon:yes stop_codon:yes gene_type:complete